MADLGAPVTMPNNRVAIYSHTHPSLTKGGAEIAAYNLFQGLRAIGVDAILIAACEEDRLDSMSLGPHEFALPYAGDLYDHFYHIASPSVRRALVDLLRSQNVDVLNAHHFLHIGVGALSDVAAAGIDVVLTIHEFLAICHNHGQLVTRTTQSLCDGPSPTRCRTCYPEHSRQQFAVRQRYVSDALKSVGAFISPSRFLATKMIEEGIPAARMSVIENGVAAPPGLPAARRVPRRKIWKFGYFGQINPFKGIDVLLAACAVIARDPLAAAQIRVVIHGGFVGQSDEFITRFHAALDQFSFLSYVGAYDNEAAVSLMRTCDYVVMPSTWWENSPVVIQEAYRAGCPVICTGIGGMAEKVIDGQTGLHFARNDPSDLADCIIEAADTAVHAQLRANLPAPPDAIDMARAYAHLLGQVAAAKTATSGDQTIDHVG